MTRNADGSVFQISDVLVFRVLAGDDRPAFDRIEIASLLRQCSPIQWS